MKKCAAPLVACLALLLSSCTDDDDVAHLTSVKEEAPGANCAGGGKQLSFGADKNGNGILDAAEIAASAYVCNGAASQGAMVTSSELPAKDPECASGGYLLLIGVDRDGNGTVDGEEAGVTRKICNGVAGAPGPSGDAGPTGDKGEKGPQGEPGQNGAASLVRLTPEPAGLNCVEDGLRVDVGLDNGDGEGLPNDGVLHDDEIDQTSYVCSRVVCGDSIVSAGETCDDGNQITETCAYGDTTACMVCNAACQLVPGEITFCGDGHVDGDHGETCDDGNAVTEACSYGAPEGCTVCTASCVEGPGIVTFCGDGHVDAANGETCDDGNRTPGDGCDQDCHSEVVTCSDTTSFSNATQLYCNGYCSWAGESGCDQADADILCKLITGSATSTATSFTIAGGDLSRAGFPCPGFGTNLGPMPEYGVSVDVHCAAGTLPANHTGDVVTNVTCSP